MNHAQLISTLKQLRLSGLATTLDVRLQEAASSRLSHGEFLTLILQDELNIRQQRRITVRSQAAGFKKMKTLEDFDWSYNPKLPKKQIYELAACQFIRDAKCALFIGQPGLGKSHLSQAIGYEAIKQGFTVLRKSIFDLVNELMADETGEEKQRTLRYYLKPDLLIIEDFAGKHLPQHSGEYLLEIVMRRYENKSILLTSNRPLEDWGKLLHDVPVATAILDRVLHHCHIVPFVGKSKRWPGAAELGLDFDRGDDTKPGAPKR
jgi:DNA replication protein DnaC